MTRITIPAFCVLLALTQAWVIPALGFFDWEQAKGMHVGRRLMRSSDSKDHDDSDAGIARIGQFMLEAQRRAMSKAPSKSPQNRRSSILSHFFGNREDSGLAKPDRVVEYFPVAHPEPINVDAVSPAADVNAAVTKGASNVVVPVASWVLNDASPADNPKEVLAPAEECPSRCSQRGLCSAAGVCTCAAAWSGSTTCDVPAVPVLPCNLPPFYLPRWSVSMETLNQDLAQYGDELCASIDQDSCKRQLPRYWARTLDLPQHDPVARLLGRKCALVAGSEWLAACGDLGGEIDAHDVVLRVDDAPTTERNYARLGARTTLRFTTGSAANFREADELTLSLDEAFMPSAGGSNLLAYPEVVRAVANTSSGTGGGISNTGAGAPRSSALRALHAALNLCGSLTLFGYSDSDTDGILADAASSDALYYDRWYSNAGFVPFAADAAAFKWDGVDRVARWEPTIEGRRFTAVMNDPAQVRAFAETVKRGIFPRPATEEKEVGWEQRKAEARCVRQLKTLLPSRVSVRMCEGKKR